MDPPDDATNSNNVERTKKDTPKDKEVTKSTTENIQKGHAPKRKLPAKGRKATMGPPPPIRSPIPRAKDSKDTEL